MKETFWTYLFIVLGLLTVAIMVLVQNLTSTSEENYYLTKEVMEAAMIDSIDYGLYRKTGDIRMIESKFVENFTRRFAESINDSKEYTLDFYEIYENPPKATVVVKTETGSQTITSDSTVNFDIRTVMSGILETKYSKSDSVLAVDLTTDKGTVLGKTKYTSYGGRVTFEIKNIPVPYILQGSVITCSDRSVKPEITSDYVIIKDIKQNTSCNISLNTGNKVTLIANGGAVVGDKIKAVSPTGQLEFKIQAFNDYTLINAELVCNNGSHIERNGEKIIVSNVEKDNEVCYVNLKKGGYYITLNVINGVSDSNFKYVAGNITSFKVSPNEGYVSKLKTAKCSNDATITYNDNTLVVGNITSSSMCTIEFYDLDAYGFYYVINKENILKYRNYGGGVLIETLPSTGSFTPLYSEKYDIILAGGGGGGGGNAHRNWGVDWFFDDFFWHYSSANASGGNGGSSLSIFTDVSLTKTSYLYSIGTGGYGGEGDRGSYWNTHTGSNGNDGSTTSFGSYSVPGGKGGQGGTVGSRHGSAYPGQTGGNAGNLFGRNTDSTRTNIYNKYGNFGRGGFGGTEYSEPGKNGEDGIIIIVYKGVI